MNDMADAVLGASDPSNCSYNTGYVFRQALYCCLTCLKESKAKLTKEQIDAKEYLHGKLVQNLRFKLFRKKWTIEVLGSMFWLTLMIQKIIFCLCTHYQPFYGFSIINVFLFAIMSLTHIIDKVTSLGWLIRIDALGCCWSFCGVEPLGSVHFDTHIFIFRFFFLFSSELLPRVLYRSFELWW